MSKSKLVVCPCCGTEVSGAARRRVVQADRELRGVVDKLLRLDDLLARLNTDNIRDFVDTIRRDLDSHILGS